MPKCGREISFSFNVFMCCGFGPWCQGGCLYESAIGKRREPGGGKYTKKHVGAGFQGVHSNTRGPGARSMYPHEK